MIMSSSLRVGSSRLERRRQAVELVPPAYPAASAAVQQYDALQRRAVGHDLLDLVGVLQVHYCDGRVGEVDAVLDVVGREQRRRGHGNHARLDHAQYGDVPLRHARPHEEGALALSDSQPGEQVGELVGLYLEVPVGVPVGGLAVRCDRNQGELGAVLPPTCRLRRTRS